MTDEQKPVEENIAEPDTAVEKVTASDNQDDAAPEEAAPVETASEVAVSEETGSEEALAEETDDLEEGADTAGALPEDEAEESGEPPRPEGTSWYVIHSYSGYENKVQKNLYHRIESMDMHDRIFQVVVPTEEEVELREGQRRTIERRVFPGYILVEMVLDEDSWYVVRNTPGVTGFVGSGNKPTPLRQDEVDKIIKRMDAEVPKVKVSFKVGQKVRIVEGPFEDFMGTVDEIDLERARVRVLVNFFGRETPIELDFLQVERT